jgi:hypothetical protein
MMQMQMQTDSESLESVLRGWQEKGKLVAVSCTGPGMHVVFSGRIGASRKGKWTIGNGRAGLVFDVQYATGQIKDPSEIPGSVRSCIDGEFVAAMELFLETGDECWFGELRIAEAAS